MSEPLKRYAVFAGDIYYPAGGWSDFKGSFDLPDDAKAEAVRWTSPAKGRQYPRHDWAHVVDLTDGSEILDI